MAQGWKEAEGLGTRCMGKMRGPTGADQDGGAGRMAWRVVGGAAMGGPLAQGRDMVNPMPSCTMNV